MLGRNSLSNWTTIGGNGHDDDDEEEMMEDIGHLNTGRKSNLTHRKSGSPLMGRLIDVSSNWNRSRSLVAAAPAAAAGIIGRRGGSESNMAAAARGRRSINPMNISHISSSSSSNGGFDDSVMMMMKEDDTWSPIRGRKSSLDNSFAVDASKRASRSLSPSRRRSSRSLSSPPTTRSPLGDISSPNRQQKKSTTLKKSPNGTFSLKEASPVVTQGSGSSFGGNGGGRKSLSFPSLSSTRKSIGFSPVVKASTPNDAAGTTTANTTTTAADSASHSEAVAATSTIRSPIPTPNSQRRLVKRFRASVPTANYMEPDEEPEKEITTRKGSNNAVALLGRFETNSAAAATTTTKQQHKDEYKNEFIFPESIPMPSTETLLLAHNQATSVGGPSHQYQLTRAGTNLLSLQEVILPSILTETSTVLKERQAKAQRNVKDGMPDYQGKDVVEVIEACRKLVQRCIGEAMKDAGESWRQREERRAQSRMERHLAQVEQRKTNELQAKRQRKEERAKSRQMRYEAAKSEMKLNHPRNKAMWTEVVHLETELQKLKKEERQWTLVKKEVDEMGLVATSTKMMDLNPIVPSRSSAAMIKQVGNTSLENTATTMVEDVTMAMNRLNWMLSSVSSAMDDSDKLRKEVFTKYQYDHKMIGFSQYDDPKDLFRMVTRKSIGGTPVRGLASRDLVC
jgi:hypothetical protein